MAYVRRRGNQLAIVHGERDPRTPNVRQRILFTLYSRPEALAVIGRGSDVDERRFRRLLEEQYPETRLDWKKIRRGIEAHLDHLPDSYEYPAARLHQRFGEDLRAFAKQIMQSDPQSIASAAQVVRDHRHELAFLVDLIQFRLLCCDKKENEWTADNKFFWRFALRGSDVPAEVEEMAAELYFKGEYDRADAVFRLLIDCFGEYADADNYLGLVAVERRQLDQAVTYFQKAIELGRREFPKRIARKSYWSDVRTRPYIRGLRNLASAFNSMGRYDEALAICGRLDAECGDDIAADTYRAIVYLNLGRYEEAVAKALRLHVIHPSQSLVAALGLFGLARRSEAAAAFLHGALNHPRAARILLNERAPKPGSSQHADDHNAGVGLRRDLHDFLARQPRASRDFFRGLLRHPRVSALERELEGAEAEWMADRRPGGNDGFRRMQRMKTPEFAREEASKLIEPAVDSWHGRNGSARK